MNYIGRVLNQKFSGDFLKEALRKADKKFLHNLETRKNLQLHYNIPISVM